MAKLRALLAFSYWQVLCWARPTRKYVTISPFPLTGIDPRRSKPYLSLRRSYVRAVTWMHPGTPWDSMRHLGHCLGVVGARVGQTPGHHVGVTDRLDLLQPVALGEPIEGREQVVEGLHDLLRGDLLAAAGEIHDVGEQHGDVGEPIGDHPLGLFESGRDRGRQDVEEQSLGFLAFQVQCAAVAHCLPEQQY